MRVLIATAEPYGSYHLAPLADAIKASSASFRQLVPYSERPYGCPVVEMTASTSAVNDCDRLVVTGGAFSAWTELVARYARSLGKPIVFSELAYVDQMAPAAPRVPVQLATALSPDSAEVLSGHLGVPNVVVTGTPALDCLPAWAPVERRALLLSTSDMELRDPDRVLIGAARALRDRGWDVVVRAHPRECLAHWDGFTLAGSETPAESAASAQVVIGYPGSAHVLAVAVGVPVISLAPNQALAAVFTERQAAVMSAHAESVDDVIELVEGVEVADPALVEMVTGPLGGASQRLVDAWTGPLSACPPAC